MFYFYCASFNYFKFLNNHDFIVFYYFRIIFYEAVVEFIIYFVYLV